MLSYCSSFRRAMTAGDKSPIPTNVTWALTSAKFARTMLPMAVPLVAAFYAWFLTF